MDLRFYNDSVFIISGPSSSGKTFFVGNLIKYSHLLFRQKINRFLWFYGIVEPTLNNTCQRIIPHKGLPDDWSKKIKPLDFVVIDDLFMEGANNKELTNAFTRLSHHKPCTLVYITQNLFQKSQDARTRSLNTHYLVLMKNPRDKTQISHIARQMYPGNSAFLVDAFNDITLKNPYSYMLLDFRQQTREYLRIRSGIFPHEDYVVFINN